MLAAGAKVGEFTHKMSSSSVGGYAHTRECSADSVHKDQVNDLRQTLWLAPHPVCKCMTTPPLLRGFGDDFFRVDIKNEGLVYFFVLILQ
jgi:hypothetical protein